MNLSEMQARAAELEQQISALPAGKADFCFARWLCHKENRQW